MSHYFNVTESEPRDGELFGVAQRTLCCWPRRWIRSEENLRTDDLWRTRWSVQINQSIFIVSRDLADMDSTGNI